MIAFKKAILLTVLFAFTGVGASLTAQDLYPSDKETPPDMEDFFSVKETFRYEVKYGFLKLGWVNVELLSDTLYQDQERKHILTEIESNSKIPFVGKELDRLHSIFYVNEDGWPVENKYWKDNIDENEMNEIQYWFDRDLGKVYYKEEDGSRDTLDLEDPATSGHLIFYVSRMHAGTQQGFALPVYVTKKKGYIFGRNSTELDERRYEAFDEPVQAYMLQGHTENIEGPFGFSGDFRAWFMNDDLRIPLEARVKVLWGNVKVKLIEYTREDL